MKGSLPTALLGLALAVAPGAAAQEGGVAPELQASFLFSVLEYDRAFEARAGDEIVIGVLYQSLFRESVNVHDGVVERLADAVATAGAARPMRVVSLDVARETDVEALLRAEGVDVLYLAPLRAAPIERMVEAARRLGVLSFSGVPDYVVEGVTVGVRALGGRPRLMVNEAAAAATGVRFSSELLKLAEIVPGDPL